MSDVYPSTDLIERVQKAHELAKDAHGVAKKYTPGYAGFAPCHAVFLLEYLERDGLRVVKS